MTRTRQPRRKIAAEFGRRAGCPFCVARLIAKPSIGEKIMFVCGFRAGTVGVVVPKPSAANLPPGWFLIQTEDEPDTQQTVRPEELYLPVDLGLGPPTWLPPLSMRELADIDEVVVSVCQRVLDGEKPTWGSHHFHDLIAHCWKRRLPLGGDEIWRLLEAHGLPARKRSRTIQTYTDGLDILIYTQGRKPIKKSGARR